MRIIALICAAAALIFTAPAIAAESGGSNEESDYERRTSNVHIPGFRYDYGFDGHTLGLGYMYAYERYDRLFMWSHIMRIGGGVDLKVLTESFESLDALATYAVGRAGFIGDAAGLGLEVSAGPVFGFGAIFPAVAPGIYYAGEWFEVGYNFQIPLFIERRGWFPSHQIGVRLHIPVFRHDVEIEKESADEVFD